MRAHSNIGMQRMKEAWHVTIEGREKDGERGRGREKRGKGEGGRMEIERREE